MQAPPRNTRGSAAARREAAFGPAREACPDRRARTGGHAWARIGTTGHATTRDDIGARPHRGLRAPPPRRRRNAEAQDRATISRGRVLERLARQEGLASARPSGRLGAGVTRTAGQSGEHPAHPEAGACARENAQGREVCRPGCRGGWGPRQVWGGRRRGSRRAHAFPPARPHCHWTAQSGSISLARASGQCKRAQWQKCCAWFRGLRPGGCTVVGLAVNGHCRMRSPDAAARRRGPGQNIMTSCCPPAQPSKRPTRPLLALVFADSHSPLELIA